MKKKISCKIALKIVFWCVYVIILYLDSIRNWLLHSTKQTDDRSATKSKEANAGKKTSVHNCEFMWKYDFFFQFDWISLRTDPTQLATTDDSHH